MGITMETCKKGHSRSELFTTNPSGFSYCKVCEAERVGIYRVRRGQVAKSKYVAASENKGAKRIANLEAKILKAQEELLIRERIAQLLVGIREAQDELVIQRAKLRSGL
jgi:hypothetical protein|tara:strand:+ start:2658 stop:2984 length:327 start_codon:yes stop_codon:yes gene_type:complete